MTRYRSSAKKRTRGNIRIAVITILAGVLIRSLSAAGKVSVKNKTTETVKVIQDHS